MPAFMVSPQKEQGVGVPDFETPQVKDALPSETGVSSKRGGKDKGDETTHFDRKVTTVNVITQEEIPRIGRVSPDFKQFHQVKLKGRVHDVGQLSKTPFPASFPADRIEWSTHVLTMDITAY